jgi:prevent-host-death family protein
MKHVNLSDARAHIGELLDEVERGETLMISREGAPPLLSEEERRAKAQEAIRGLLELRKSAGRATVEEILAWRDEGRE